MLKINPDFENLIPPLSEDEFSGLEKSILEEGVREPIVTWRGFIVDGHNRYKIATKYGLDFDTVEYDFADEAAVIDWMVETQCSRRNLELFQKTALRIKADKLKLAAIAKKGQGARHDIFASSRKSFVSHNTDKEIANAAGVSTNTVHRVNKILNSGDANLIEQCERGETSINAAYKQIREAEKKAERKAAIEEAKAQPRSASYVDIFNTDKKYRVVYADPPWSYNDKQDTAKLGGAEKYYHTMALDDICAIQVPTEKNAVLFLWATSPLLPEALAVITDWGFTYKSSFIWDKVSHAMGHYNSVRHEFLLIAVKGSCTPDVKKLYDSVVSIERTEHSRKPAYFRELIDELYPIGERIELFAREAADGWDVWGDMA